MHALAKALFHKGDYKQSLDTLKQSDQTARVMGYQQQINSNLALFSLIYAVDNQPDKAAYFHEQFVFETT